MIVALPDGNLLIAFVYISPKHSLLANAKELIDHFLRKTPQSVSTIIMGDFNLHMASFENHMRVKGFHQLINEPTIDYHSVLDNIYTNDPSRISSSGTLESYHSDHKFIHAVVQK